MAKSPKSPTKLDAKRTSRSKTPRKTKPLPTPEQMLEYYKQMLVIRRFEEKAGQLYGMGLIGGFCHLYIGQEAVVVGMKAVDAPDISTV